MTPFLAAAATMLLSAGAQLDPGLVGTWNAAGEPFLVLNADGTGRMEEGPVRWEAAGGVLAVQAADGSGDRVAYRLSGDALTLSLPAGPVELTRTKRSLLDPGRKVAAPAPGPAVAAGPAGVPAGARAVRFNGRALGAAEL